MKSLNKKIHAIYNLFQGNRMWYGVSRSFESHSIQIFLYLWCINKFDIDYKQMEEYS